MAEQKTIADYFPPEHRERLTALFAQNDKRIGQMMLERLGQALTDSPEDANHIALRLLAGPNAGDQAALIEHYEWCKANLPKTR